MRERLEMVVLGAMAIALLLPGMAAGQAINLDMGVSERTWMFRSTPGSDLVIFAWMPVMSVFDAEQFLIGECYRVNESGELVGRHRVIFKNIMLAGIDSGNTVEGEKSTQRIRNGLQKRQAVWLLTDLARSLFAEDSAVLVAGEITVTRKVDAFDELTCGLAVMEILDVGALSVAGAADTSELGTLKPVHDVQVPRLFRVAGGVE